MFQVSNFVHINVILYIAPKEKISGVESGLLDGHRFEPPLPIHVPGNVSPRIPVTFVEKCGHAPSC
jgi:hypothetical protein